MTDGEGQQRTAPAAAGLAEGKGGRVGIRVSVEFIGWFCGLSWAEQVVGQSLTSTPKLVVFKWVTLSFVSCSCWHCVPRSRPRHGPPSCRAGTDTTPIVSCSCSCSCRVFSVVRRAARRVWPIWTSIVGTSFRGRICAALSPTRRRSRAPSAARTWQLVAAAQFS
jgi:hypothetical protein